MKSTWMLLPAGILSAALWAGDWPQLRGPQSNGISQETGLLPEWPKQGPKAALATLRYRRGLRHARGSGRPPLCHDQSRHGKRIRPRPFGGGRQDHLDRAPGQCRQPEPAAALSDGPLHSHRRRRQALRTEFRWRPGVSGNSVRKSALAQEPAPRFRRTARHLGVCRIAADRRRRAGGHTGRSAGHTGGAEQEDRRRHLAIRRAWRRARRIRFGIRHRGRRPQTVRPVPRQRRGWRRCQDRPVPVALRTDGQRAGEHRHAGQPRRPTSTAPTRAASAPAWCACLPQATASPPGRCTSNATCRTRWAARSCSATRSTEPTRKVP